MPTRNGVASSSESSGGIATRTDLDYGTIDDVSPADGDDPGAALLACAPLSSPGTRLVRSAAVGFVALTWEQGAAVAQGIITVLLTVLGFAAAQFVARLRQAQETNERRFAEMDQRLTKAGQKQSDLTDKLHLLPERETVNRIWEDVSTLRHALADVSDKTLIDGATYRAQIDDIFRRLAALEERRSGVDRRDQRNRS